MTYTAWDGVSAVEKMSPRDAPAVIGAHWTTRLSRVADRIEPYEAKRRKVVPRPIIDRHLPTVKRVGGKLVKTGRTKAAETVRSISYDVSSVNDKDKLIREVATGQGKLRPGIAKSAWGVVHKMGPDQSELHVAGSSNQRRKARLRKLPPDAIRRVC